MATLPDARGPTHEHLPALRAEGEVVHVGRTIATARGEVRDDRDRVIATAVTTCIVSPPPEARPSIPPRPEEGAA